MKKINFGCGGNKQPGWENYDMEVDITKPLPFENDSVDFILAEHVVEHVSMHQGYGFIKEVSRILKPGGVAKILVPDITKISRNRNDPYFDSYLRFYHEMGWTDGTIESSFERMAFFYEHQSLWTEELLLTVMESVGLNAYSAEIYDSKYPEIKDVTGHWNTYQILKPWVDGRKINLIDTACVEGVKP